MVSFQKKRTPWHCTQWRTFSATLRPIVQNNPLFIQKHWKAGYREFPHLKGLSPAQVLAMLPEQDERYRLGEAGLVVILRDVE